MPIPSDTSLMLLSFLGTSHFRGPPTFPYPEYYYSEYTPKEDNQLLEGEAGLVHFCITLNPSIKPVYSRHSNNTEMTKLFWGNPMWPSRGQMGPLHLGRRRQFFKDIFQLHTFIFYLNTPKMWWPCNFSFGNTKEGPNSRAESECYHLLLYNNFDKGQCGEKLFRA